MADSFLFNINLTFSNLNKVLQRCPAAYTTHTASAAPVRKPGDCQSNPIEVLNTPPPLHSVALAAWHKVSQAPLTPSWLRQPWYAGVESLV